MAESVQFNKSDVLRTWDDVGVGSRTVTATLYEDGTFTVTGAGDMDGWSFEDDSVSPWMDDRVHDSIIRVVIGDGITSIGSEAFFLCGCMTSVTIPNSVTAICDSAFEACISLTSVTIPAGVDTIRRRAFYGCDELKSVINLSVTPQRCESLQRYESVFSDEIFSSATLYVPPTAVNAYKSADGWKEFKCIKDTASR